MLLTANITKKKQAAMKQIDKYIKRNKHECIWDLGLYILLTVDSIPLSEIIPLLRGLLLHLFFNIHIFFRGERPGMVVLFWGLFVFVFTAWTITNRESLCRPLLNPNAVR